MESCFCIWDDLANPNDGLNLILNLLVPLDEPKAKILFFGNKDVSDNDFSLNQPFIIAEEFIAERIK